MPHHASDQPSHIVLASTPAVTQGNMETNDYWDGGQQLGLNVPENTVAPETRPVQHLYPHDTGRTDRACEFLFAVFEVMCRPRLDCFID